MVQSPWPGWIWTPDCVCWNQTHLTLSLTWGLSRFLESQPGVCKSKSSLCWRVCCSIHFQLSDELFNTKKAFIYRPQINTEEDWQKGNGKKKLNWNQNSTCMKELSLILNLRTTFLGIKFHFWHNLEQNFYLYELKWEDFI